MQNSAHSLGRAAARRLRAPAGLGLLLLAAAACGGGPPLEEPVHEGFYAPDAQLEVPHLLEHVGDRNHARDKGTYHVEAHRIDFGQGVVLAYRGYEERPGAAGGGRYEKLSVWLRAGLPRRARTYDLAREEADVLVVWSRGPADVPEAGEYARLRAGSLWVGPDGDGRVLARLQAAFTPTDAFLDAPAAPVRLDLSLSLHERPVAELSAWEGRRGVAVGEETRPEPDEG